MAKKNPTNKSRAARQIAARTGKTYAQALNDLRKQGERHPGVSDLAADRLISSGRTEEAGDVELLSQLSARVVACRAADEWVLGFVVDDDLTNYAFVDGRVSLRQLQSRFPGLELEESVPTEPAEVVLLERLTPGEPSVFGPFGDEISASEYMDEHGLADDDWKLVWRPATSEFCRFCYQPALPGRHQRSSLISDGNNVVCDDCWDDRLR